MSAPPLTLIVVGAGATVAEATSSVKAPHDLPPLDATFFANCRSRRLVRGSSIEDYVEREYGFDPFDGNHGMEEVFNLLYSDVLMPDPPRSALRAYWDLLTLYRRAISVSTNELTGNSRGGVAALARHLLALDPARAMTFLTFNHDLLIEKAIQILLGSNRAATSTWNLRAAYVLRFKSYPVPAGGKGSFPASPRPLHTDIKVLKLHGSLNWLYPVKSLADPKNAIRVPRSQLICANTDLVYPTYELEGVPRGAQLVPLVVPPIYEKSSKTKEALGPVWAAADQAVAAATEIYIFGYSFPMADVASATLFRRAFHRNSQVSHVHVIDPNASVSARVSQLLNPRALSVYSDVRSLREQIPAA